MAMPIGAIAGSLAAIYGHSHNEVRDELNTSYYEDLEKLKEKGNAILEYLKKAFKTNKVIIVDNYDLGSTVYHLSFDIVDIGIQIDNTTIINANIDNLYKYSYHLVFSELINNTKKRYVNLESKGNYLC